MTLNKVHRFLYFLFFNCYLSTIEDILWAKNIKQKQEDWKPADEIR